MKRAFGKQYSASTVGLLPLLVLLILPAGAQAQFTFTTNADNTITITGYTGPGGGVTIPSMLDGLPVKTIANSAFYKSANLCSVDLPNSVTNIGNAAFACCIALTNISIPESVTTIGTHAFLDCEILPNVTIPDTVTTIGESAFCACSNLTNVVLGKSVTSVRDRVFAYCTRLTGLTIPASVTNIGAAAFHDCCNLTSITIPDSVITVGDAAFWGCTNLTQATIGNGVRNTGVDLFRDCENLRILNIGNGVPSIDFGMFPFCTNLTSVTIGTGVTRIGAYVFMFCASLTNIAIPDNVKTIETNAFLACRGLTNVTIGNGVTNVGEYAFYGCTTLCSIKLGRSIVTIGDCAFAGCTSLTTVTIPDSVTSLGAAPFNGCTNLANIIVGNGLTRLGDKAFGSCVPGALTGVYFRGNAPKCDGTLFLGADNVTVYYLPGTTGWGPTFAGRPTALWNAVGTVIGKISFKDYDGLPLPNATEEQKNNIGSVLRIKVFEANKAYLGTQKFTSVLVAEELVDNSSHLPVVPFTLTGEHLRPNVAYDLAVSASGHNDWQVIPIQLKPDGTNTINVTITFDDMRKNGYDPSLANHRMPLTYRFDTNMSDKEQQAAVKAGMSIWANTGLISFQEADSSIPGEDILFTWAELGTSSRAPLADSPTDYLTLHKHAIEFNLNSPLWVQGTGKTSQAITWHTYLGLWDTPCRMDLDPDGSRTNILTSITVHELGHVLGGFREGYDSQGSGDVDIDGSQYTVMSNVGELGWLGYSDVLSLYLRQQLGSLTIVVSCPVELIVVDPDGNQVSKSLNTIPSGSYCEEGISGSGTPAKRITIAKPITGNYTIYVVPQAGADPTNTVTLTFIDGQREYVLLKEVPIGKLSTNAFSMPLDRTAPRLSVKASPSVITGSDERFVTIATSVQVSDEDTNVQVTLLNVICSDGPNTNAVTGAIIGSDDRTFNVQAATRSGKRVYTIVYSASDSSGNVSEATTDVVVIAQPGGILLEAPYYDLTKTLTLRVFSEPGRVVGIQASTNLKDWTEIGTLNLVDGRGAFRDLGGVTMPHRYYRAVLK